MTQARNTTIKKRKPHGISDPIVKMLNELHPINQEIVKYLDKHLSEGSIKKGKYLLKSGSVCTHVYFIKKGILRGYVKETTKEITTWINAENDLVTSVSSFDDQVPAIENIQALEDCEYLSISFNDFQNLYQELPEFNIVGRKLLQRYYRIAEGRAFVARLTRAEYKYEYFLKNYTHLLNRLAIKHIASYLGITLETLSRIRKRMSMRKVA
jgi:CRP-like cAMP-binding protein